MKINNFLKLIISVVGAELVGIIGSVFTAPAIKSGWYAGLAKPEIAPPNWIFAPVWTALFALMGVAVFLVWKSGFEKRNVKIALIIFDIQLVLNIFWSAIFFGLKNPGWAFVEIIFLWLAILFTIIFFAKISKTSAYLLIPYIIWVSFAGYLNFLIWKINDLVKIEPVFCTQEVKVCSDGSYVGRTGSKCEFALCPKENLIRIESPSSNEEISSPLLMSGQARGYWFFEASFPVILVDWDGKIIAQGIATAQDEWMTEDFVPFKAEIEFEKPEFIGDFSKRGALIFKKDNPSGLPEHDDALEIPIVFK